MGGRTPRQRVGQRRNTTDRPLGSNREWMKMAKPPRPWIVTKHGPIEKLDDNLWVVEGDVPGMPFRRRMSIIKRADGTLLFVNAIPLESSALAEVQAWGKPSILVVPHDQ